VFSVDARRVHLAGSGPGGRVGVAEGNGSGPLNADWALVGANAEVKMQVSGRGPRWAAPQVHQRHRNC
jgi:hypothetical protein